MKTSKSWLLACVCLLALHGAARAQVGPITFEPGGTGTDWTWTVFENATNPAVEMVPNPAPSGLNTSAQVMRFTALQAGQPWAGCESQHGSDIGTFSFTGANCTVRMLVLKPVASNVGVKFARADGGAEPEILVANTQVNQWEELVFDFSGRIGTYGGTDLDQIIFFPDFDLAGRTGDHTIYIDNVRFEPAIQPDGPTTPAPLPNHAQVISLFSGAYTNVPVGTWSATWDQAEVSTYLIGSDEVKYYSNLVFAGIEFTSPTIDATGMSHFHMDIWTPEPTAMPVDFRVKLVDFGANGVWSGGDDVEHELSFDATSNPPLVTGEWVSLDIPLSAFTGLVTRGHLAQLVLSGGLDRVFVDNIYFHDGSTSVDEPGQRPASARLDPNHPNPFNPSTTLGYELARPGHATLSVHDLQGRLVRVLVDGGVAAGHHSVDWNGTDGQGIPSASGVYLCRLVVDGVLVDTVRMVLVK